MASGEYAKPRRKMPRHGAGPQGRVDMAIYYINDRLYKEVSRRMPDLDAMLAALSDPTRRALLARLAGGEATVQDLARPFAISQPAVSHHLRVLAAAGLIETRVAGSARPRRLRPGAMAALWDAMAAFRTQIEARYARLDGLLAEMEGKDDPTDA